MSETSGMTIVEFLEARIAEDEAKANTLLANTQSGYDINEYAERMIAECAAKRRMVGYYRMLIEQSEQAEVFGYHATGLKVALRFLASIHKGHPDYRQEWSA